MPRWAIWSLVVFGILSAPRAQGAEVLRALDECPTTEPACLGMTMDLIWKNRPAHTQGNLKLHPIVVAEDRHEDEYTSNYRMSVTGRLNSGAIKKYLLVASNYWGGMDCFDFWVAVVGLTADGSGMILTDKGTLTLVDTPLDVGCQDCLALINKKTLAVSFIVIPFWDVGARNFGPKYGGPIVHPDGAIYWIENGACVKTKRGEVFRAADSKMCVAPDPVLADASAIERVQVAHINDDEYSSERLKHRLFNIEGTPFFMYRLSGACT